jgi:hypothetical protein
VPEVTRAENVKAPVKARQHSPLASQITRQLQLKTELFGDPLLSLREVSVALGGVSYSTLRALIVSKKLATFRISKHGWHRVRASVLKKFIASSENGVPKP